MKSLLTLIFLFVTTSAFTQDIVQEYIHRWKTFYPSQALRMGMHDAVFDFEQGGDVQEWINYNRLIFQSLDENGNPDINAEAINLRLLKSQVLQELYKWTEERPHEHSLSYYTNLLSNFSNRPSRASFLTEDDLRNLRCKSYDALINICLSIKSHLKNIHDENTERSINTINNIKVDLNSQLKKDLSNQPCEGSNAKVELAMDQLDSILDHIKKIPHQPQSLILGKEYYGKQLAMYTDSNLAPAELEKLAMEEIVETKKLMAEVSQSYLSETYPYKTLPTNEDDIITLALDDMEKDVVTSAHEYLKFWEGLTQAATRFVDEKEIATLPDYPTLQIKTAPESAGAAARIGWVSSAPPFDPNPVTTLYLPSIPDTLSEQEQIDFWSSFNKPFNRMIVIHELIPGHYMQLKVSRETPHKIRLMFPYGPYIEGWATFTEKIVLEAGWEKERPLTYLAHLRKRLENANRAYTSVMVHCNGWDQEQVMKFSTETSLLAPQFAKSLWGRLMRSPMQITSYFYGGALFKELYAHETARLGNDFDLKHFMDTIMKAGPIPVDEFYHIFNQTHD
ncbi:MAG: DUF885 family protein [Saprospiraceae bacterium]|nr:DUF885 family protein [Saprospiraceae bacterium]